jgi:D-xylonolactonase
VDITAGKVHAPQGRLSVVEFPVTRVASCAFGGRHGDVLDVTSAVYQLTSERSSAQPLAGSLFAVDPGVAGPAATPFAGLLH